MIEKQFSKIKSVSAKCRALEEFNRFRGEENPKLDDLTFVQPNAICRFLQTPSRPDFSSSSSSPEMDLSAVPKKLSVCGALNACTTIAAVTAGGRVSGTKRLLTLEPKTV